MSDHERTGRRRSGGKPGRRSKGVRYARTIRFPDDLHETIEGSYSAAGYDNINDYVVDIVYRARDAGLFPEAAPGQERLPISA